MSYYNYAYAFRGIKVTPDRMYSERRTRGCEHQLLYGDFCPTCGKPKWVGEDTPISGFDGEKDYEGLEVEFFDEAVYIGRSLTEVLCAEDNEESTVIDNTVEVTVKGFDEPVRDYLILTGG